MINEVKLNLKAAAELQLNLEELTLLTFMLNKAMYSLSLSEIWYNGHRQVQTIRDENDDIFFLFPPASVAKEMPILIVDSKGDTRAKTIKIQRISAQLIKKNLIAPHPNNQVWTKTYYTFSKKVMLLLGDLPSEATKKIQTTEEFEF